MGSILPVQLLLFPLDKTCRVCGESKPVAQFPHNERRCRACTAAATKAWNAAHPGANAQRVTAWQKAHPEERRAHGKSYREQHPSENRVRHARYYAAHRDQEDTRNAAYRDARPIERVLWVHRRRARAWAAAGSHTVADIRRLADKQQGLCAYCAQPYGRYEVEHKTPLSRGGSNWPENLCLSCRPCNLRKGTKTDTEFRAWLEYLKELES